ncbi:nucleophile aminohydrolase [Corynascus novoguineensis]|uniref:Nucleophile aminohydrolase n=1 Tax=Corynascus novoguineensis TaxID=1126955 RepID=A0AAN7HHH5_9PEZI|nr:nucleophile aminohydrolase [Corynascus novoguineensis]
MSFLKAGATATQAVEAAIRCLEDKEITNAGFGSNLNIDGVVECDATIVDHLGRSGACGAVAGVKNPISLAKKILDTSSRPLSLQRIPPNLLVGPGAKDFAEEHALKTVRNEFLVSRNAKDRYLRWNEDLKRAEARKKPRAGYPGTHWSTQRTSPSGAYDKAANPAKNAQFQDHTSATLTGTWNEGQPDSPDPDRSPIGNSGSRTATSFSTLSRSITSKTTDFQPPISLSAPTESVDCGGLKTESPYLAPVPPSSHSVNDGPANCDETEVAMVDGDASCDKDRLNQAIRQQSEDWRHAADNVTDTVGAIAVDLQGNIAAGSSSGGIGMKHCGRTGPAALVGVGTAVVPEDSEDDLSTSVAAVTSGTGEHMATCLASGKCAERLFQGTRRGVGGRDIPEEDEHAILESFILNDFLNHPGVRDQPSAGAIGVMAVKKDRTGVYFYFAHNTDSFALASMSSVEREPLCVMSRLGKSGRVAQGGRRIRLG